MNKSETSNIIHTENAVKEIWSMLGFFESEYNVGTYLTTRFQQIQSSSEFQERLPELKLTIAYTVRTAREYYTAAEGVTDLTRPLLLFYGMSNLAKVLFMCKHGKLSPSRSHGLTDVDESLDFAEQLVEINQDGTFPMFHGCFSKQNLKGISFSLRELLSLVPELKPNFEAIYKQKSNSIRIYNVKFGTRFSDPEFKKYEWLKILKITPDFGDNYRHFQFFDEGATLFHTANIEKELFISAGLSGEEYFVLPLLKKQKSVILPELSTHYLIMYLLSILCRYTSKKWLELLMGTKSGEMYIVEKFLEVSFRKFPNLILNQLHDEKFIFTSPVLQRSNRLNSEELDEIYEDFQRRTAFGLMGQ
jgi:hypothetical protein